MRQDNGPSCQSSAANCQNPDNATSNRQPDDTHPETHQNLIHPDKEHSPTIHVTKDAHQRGQQRHYPKPRTSRPRSTATPILLLLRDPANPSLNTRTLVEVIGIEPTTPCL